jgi:hypothetical protein
MKDFKKFFKAIDPSVKYDADQLALGIKVEGEHTKNKKIATIIAKQHLAEDPQYYSKLKKVENK